MRSQSFRGRTCGVGSVGSRGFSLVELMIAMVVGLVIVLGAGQIFIAGLQSFRQLDELSRRQETVRYVSDVMLDDIRSAFNSISTTTVGGVDLACEAFVIPVIDGDGNVTTSAEGCPSLLPVDASLPDTVASDGSESSTTLILEYFSIEDGVAVGRPGLPYCTAADGDLHWLKYVFSKEKGELSAFYECHVVDLDDDPLDEDHDITEVNSMSSGGVVASGLKNVIFSYAGDFTINVALVFPPLEEGGSDKLFNFQVTNRAKALSFINGVVD